MQSKFLTGLIIATVSVASVFHATTASALQLSNSIWSEFNQYVQRERLQLSGAELLELDPASLRWANGVDNAEIYFINEGAGFRNALYYSVNNSPERLIWGDIASPNSILPESNGPLTLGQGFSLGSYQGDTQLSLSLAPNGSSTRRYGAVAANNPDGLQHMVAYNVNAGGENWVLIGFEDLFGPRGATGGENQNSDRDFNDVVVAVRGVTGNAAVGVPEPSAMLALLGVGSFFGLRRRRQSTNEAQ
ncbi:DUF4114 domain-containing protein [Floridanema evergladense]|uniref:DUF4114 domain-containing protein n=1 Tax=Floridaenema evergladense BLCC-F167 TaxID=3153639 RepID=A0ABV4WV60_9CYAN